MTPDRSDASGAMSASGAADTPGGLSRAADTAGSPPAAAGTHGGAYGPAEAPGGASEEAGGDASLLGGALRGTGATSSAENLALVSEAFGLHQGAAASLLRVAPAELEQWSLAGVPEEHWAEVEALAALARRLLATYRPGLVPRVMRAPVPGGSGWSALDAIRAGHYDAVMRLMAPVGDYVMDADPEGVRQQRAEATRHALDRELEGELGDEA